MCCSYGLYDYYKRMFIKLFERMRNLKASPVRFYLLTVVCRSFVGIEFKLLRLIKIIATTSVNFMGILATAFEK